MGTSTKYVIARLRKPTWSKVKKIALLDNAPYLEVVDFVIQRFVEVPITKLKVIEDLTNRRISILPAIISDQLSYKEIEQKINSYLDYKTITIFDVNDVILLLRTDKKREEAVVLGNI